MTREVTIEAADQLPEPRARVQEPRRSDSRRNRDRVLEAAVRVLSDDPDATVERVADEAGLARSTVYRRFGSRDGLIAAVRRRTMEENQALFRETVAREPDFARCMDELMHASVHLAHRRRRLWRRLAEIGAELRLEDFDTRDEFVGWLERGRRERVIRGDLPLGWIVAVWMHMVMAGGDATDQHGVDIDEAARMATEAAARALRAR